MKATAERTDVPFAAVTLGTIRHGNPECVVDAHDRGVLDMGRIIEVHEECNTKIEIIGYERGTRVPYCPSCENYLHPDEVVKRYV